MRHPLIEDDIEEEFLVARGLAVSQYAYFEGALLTLFSHLMGCPPDIAGVPFFRINNARSRSASIERLLKKKHGGTYNLFWNSLAKWMQALDESRNWIVHWTTVTTFTGISKSLALTPPNFWDTTPNRNTLEQEKLYAFAEKCQFTRELLYGFTMQLEDVANLPPTWHGIFLQPVTYPPPAGHPLFQTP